MKRTPIRRGKPLQRGTTPLARTTRMAKRNARRKGSRFPKLRDPAYCAWVRSMPCLLAVDLLPKERRCAGRVECAHVRSRGAGGNDVANTVPLCTRHHREQHAVGIQTFQARYGLHLEWDAFWLAFRYPASPASASPEGDG